MLDTEALGRLVLNIGRAGFDAAFFELARHTLDISSCSAFAFEMERKPWSVVLEGLGPEQRLRTKSLGSAYVQDGFRHDPQLRDLFELAELEVRLVSPADIGDTEFRGYYYDEPRIVSEIAVLGQYRGKRFNVGFYRGAGKAEFDSAAIDQAKALVRVALPALHRHIELQLANPDGHGAPSPPANDAKPIGQAVEHLTAVLLTEGHGLSPREAQVCAAIILGYRTPAISLNLGISENTTCTHRKRAYAKLGISSQNELFARYFRTVARINRSEATTSESLAAPIVSDA